MMLEYFVSLIVIALGIKVYLEFGQRRLIIDELKEISSVLQEELAILNKHLESIKRVK